MGKQAKNKQQRDRYSKMGIYNFRNDGVVFPYRVITSAEYLALSGSAVKVLHNLMTQYNGFNNGALKAPQTRAQELFGIAKRTLKNAIDELLEKNFITVARAGGKHQCMLYAVTFYDMDVLDGLTLETPNPLSDLWKISQKQLTETIAKDYF